MAGDSKFFVVMQWGCWKTRNAQERNGTERNGTGSNLYPIWMWTPDTHWKIGINMSAHRELISRPVPATKTGQAPSRQYRATPSVLNILVVYLVPSSGVADPSLTSEGLAMPLPSLGSAVGSDVTCGSPWNRKEWYCVLYSPQIRNKHHHRASAFMLTSGKLGQLLAQP